MLGEMLDTDARGRARYYELLRAMTLAERMRAVDGASRALRELAIEGIKLRHPRSTDDEVKVRLAALLYGRAAASRLFGAVPDEL